MWIGYDGLGTSAVSPGPTSVSMRCEKPSFAPILRRNREVAVADTVRHLKEAIVEGRIADGDPEIIAHAILGVVDQLTRRYLIERDEPVDQIAQAAIAFCVTGITGG